MARDILVVEDDPHIRALLTDCFMLMGYRVRTAIHGQDALRVLSEWQPDLILLDLMMPVMDGWTFLHERQANPGLQEIPVLVMSATTSLYQRPIPADAFVSKPFSIDDLIEQVESLISYQHRRTEIHPA
jgi:CheY-like chemotaxis protein